VGVTGSATDADATTNTITYSLDDDAGGRFAINSSTGVVTVAGAIDRETAASHTITVRATSSDTSFSTQNFTINVNDVDEFDVGAVSDTDATVNAVNENAAIGTTVGVTANATDADATNNTITYSLDDSSGGLFTIDSATGVVTVSGLPDYETAISHTITVRATSTDSSFTIQTFNIAVNDVNEAPIVNNQSFSVDENAPNGTVVGTLIANDPDPGDTLTYAITAGNTSGAFAIDPSTGQITVNNAAALDFETSHTFTLTIEVTDAGAPGLTRTAIVTVNLNDLYEDSGGGDSTSDSDPSGSDQGDGDASSDTRPGFQDNDPVPPQEGPLEPGMIDHYWSLENSYDAGETAVNTANQEIDQTEILYLTDSNHQDRQNGRRGTSGDYLYLENKFLSEIRSYHHSNLAAQVMENAPTLMELNDSSAIDFRSDELRKVAESGEYDNIREEIDQAFDSEGKTRSITTSAVTLTAATFTAGLVTYLLRIGSMLASLLSSMPLWRGFDPIVVFSPKEKDETSTDETKNPAEQQAEDFFKGEGQ
jgi:hypothetical protein